MICSSFINKDIPFFGNSPPYPDGYKGPYIELNFEFNQSSNLEEVVRLTIFLRGRHTEIRN